VIIGFAAGWKPALPTIYWLDCFAPPSGHSIGARARRRVRTLIPTLLRLCRQSFSTVTIWDRERICNLPLEFSALSQNFPPHCVCTCVMGIRCHNNAERGMREGAIHAGPARSYCAAAEREKKHPVFAGQRSALMVGRDSVELLHDPRESHLLISNDRDLSARFETRPTERVLRCYSRLKDSSASKPVSRPGPPRPNRALQETSFYSKKPLPRCVCTDERRCRMTTMQDDIKQFPARVSGGAGWGGEQQEPCVHPNPPVNL